MAYEFCVYICNVLHEQSLKSINYREEAEKTDKQTVECRCLLQCRTGSAKPLPVTHFCFTLMALNKNPSDLTY